MRIFVISRARELVSVVQNIRTNLQFEVRIINKAHAIKNFHIIDLNADENFYGITNTHFKEQHSIHGWAEIIGNELRGSIFSTNLHKVKLFL